MSNRKPPVLARTDFFPLSKTNRQIISIVIVIAMARTFITSTTSQARQSQGLGESVDSTRRRDGQRSRLPPFRTRDKASFECVCRRYICLCGAGKSASELKAENRLRKELAHARLDVIEASPGIQNRTVRIDAVSLYLSHSSSILTDGNAAGRTCHRLVIPESKFTA